MEEGHIYCKAIIEMLGGPKEHIQQVMKDYVEKKLKDQSEFKIVNTKYADPKSQGKLFSTFVELDLDFTKVGDLIGFVFDAMPSSLEVSKPEHIEFEVNILNDLLNDLSARIHQTDMLIKNLRSQNDLINKNSIDLLRSFVRFIIRAGDTSLEGISQKIGITEKEIKPFLDRMLEDNLISAKRALIASSGISK